MTRRTWLITQLTVSCGLLFHNGMKAGVAIDNGRIADIVFYGVLAYAWYRIAAWSAEEIRHESHQRP